MIEVVAKLPTKLRLKVNGDKLSRNVGNKLATYVRRQWKSGRTGGGESIPSAEEQPEGGQPLYRTGELLKSVRYSRYHTFVTANNLRREHGGRTLSRRAWSLYGLVRILASGKWRRGRQKGVPVRPPVDLFGDSSEAVAQRKTDAAQKELQRQLAKNEAGLLVELQQQYRMGARRAKW
jgi:hypothetical protein